MGSVAAPTFAHLLRRYRRAIRLTQEELAARAGVSTRAISDLERGVRVAPHKDTLDLLAQALGLEGDDHAAFIAAGRRSAPLARPAISALPDAPVHTFLIADVRGYTAFTLEHGDVEAARLAARLAELARGVVEAHSGRVIELRGDEALAVFASSRQALRAAVAMQARFVAAVEADPSLPLSVGIGLDAGEALPVEGGYRGAALNLAARLCALARAGEVLASEGVMYLARKVEGLAYEDRGTVRLKGFSDPIRVLRVLPNAGDSGSAESADAPAGSMMTAPATPTRDVVTVERPFPVGGFLGALLDVPLVERAAEMARLAAVFDAVANGFGRLVMLGGEPGVGKTRLAQEATLALRNRGFLVATGRCYEPQSSVAYYPFLEALQRAAAQAPLAVRRELPTRWSEVYRLLPAEAAAEMGAAALAGTRGADDQQRLFWQVTGWLQALAAERPVALLMDDLHWADAASLALLQHLARHTRADRILLVGTFRDVEVRRWHPLDAALSDLSREQLVERIAVRPLTEEGTRALIGTTAEVAAVSVAFAHLLHARTAGNPFFTHELLQVLVERGDLYQQDGHWERRALDAIVAVGVPESVRAVIGHRVARLATGTQETLHEASVLGAAFTFGDLRGMSDRPDEAVEQALDEAIAAGLLRETGHDGYSFRHVLIQQALLADLSARRRRRLHRAAGEVIERAPEHERDRRSAELGWHFAEAGEQARALPYAVRAGDQAAEVYAHAEAEQNYRTALALAREVGDRPREAETLEKLGDVLSIQARYDDALGALDQAAALYLAGGEQEAYRRTVARIGRQHALRGTPEQGIALLAPIADQLEVNGAPAPSWVHVYMTLAQLYNECGRYREQLEVAERASSTARQLGDDRLVARVEQGRGPALLLLGRVDEALAALQSVVPMVDEARDAHTLAWVLYHLTLIHDHRGEFAESEAYAERALALAKRQGDPVGISFYLCARGESAFYLGEWRRARADFEQAWSVARQSGVAWQAAAVPPLDLATLSMAEGDSAAASTYLDACLPRIERGGDLQLLRIAGSILAERDLLEGRPAAALARLAPLLDRPSLEEPDVTGLMALSAWTHLELGDVAAAAELAARAVARARTQQHRFIQPEVLRAAALVAARQGEWASARDSVDEALDLTRAMRYPYAEARVLYVAGQIALEQGDWTQAHTRLPTALAICDSLGERLYGAKIEQALAASVIPGASPPRGSAHAG